jgi:hypothetical protein
MFVFDILFFAFSVANPRFLLALANRIGWSPSSDDDFCHSGELISTADETNSSVNACDFCHCGVFIRLVTSKDFMKDEKLK